MTPREESWSERDTTPEAVAEALHDLIRPTEPDAEPHTPARVLNLVAIIESARRTEVHARLEGIGRYNPSRTILCVVEPGRERLDARVSVSAEVPERGPGVCLEHVEVELGEDHLRHLDTIVDPLLVTDLATLAWAPHGHRDAVDSLRRLAHVVLVDSVDEPRARTALDRAAELYEHAYVVDLAWLRATPWRERLAAVFDPPRWRDELETVSSLTVRHARDSSASALLFAGWLASRLGWEAGPLTQGAGHSQGCARRDGSDVAVRLESTDMPVPGLAGVTVESESGFAVSLDRAPGGMRAERRTEAGEPGRPWFVFGASRGEGGILGEGVRQALLRDSVHRAALDAAREMAT